MKTRLTHIAFIYAILSLFAGTEWAADSGSDAPHQPHTPTLIFYLSAAKDQTDVDAIGVSIKKLKSAAVVEVNTNRGFARVRFDSHVVSYHQVAQAIADAGKTLGKTYNPHLVFSVAEYAQKDNAADVDAIFAGKRLNSRVHIQSLDKSKGRFLVYFLPLTLDPKNPAPQGFNGGHLHHPISDPPPRGLGLTSSYASDDDLSIVPDGKAGPTTNRTLQTP